MAKKEKKAGKARERAPKVKIESSKGKGGQVGGPSNKPIGVVLIGPTGSGKTPLGEYLQKYGFLGKRCMHFDFGHHLRMVVTGQEPTPLMTQKDVEFIVGVLESGVLLEDEHFHIAARILKNFLNINNVKKEDILILNGLPRHEGQVKDIGKILDVRAVIYLNCTPKVAKARIDSNAGGDRKARMDDSLKAIEHRLKTFLRRTLPLVDLYRNLGAKVAVVQVGEQSLPDELARKAAAELGEAGKKKGKK